VSPEIQNGKLAGRMPRATYRFQFHEGFPLRCGLALVPYLRELGVSHLYASPLLKARPHSTHGYDTCDFNQLNPEVGTEADLAELVEALRAHGMGLVLDIVPNHMGVGGPENFWWWDVLERGPESRFAGCFDIDWNSPDPRLRGKVLLPVLDDLYHRALEKRELKLEDHDGTLRLRYRDNVFPLRASSLHKMEGGLEKINAGPEALDALIQQQFYRPTWSVHGDSELNYRRFFNISGLAALAVEDERVFGQVMALTSQWLQRGWVDGLRVDHPDGLRDPEQFMQRLKGVAPQAWVVLEKILGPDELLPVSWPVAGTTGYDFLNHAGGLFIDPAGAKPLTELYGAFCGNTVDYIPLALEKKHLVLRTLLAAETERVTGLLVRAAAPSWRHCDFTRAEWSEALVELAASFPVYRSYVQPQTGSVKDSDSGPILHAVNEARRRRLDLAPELFEFLRDVLLLKRQGNLEREFVARFQQLTTPAMAKGVEDTAFYCYNRFVALNEVGGNPGRFGCSVDDFHHFCTRLQANWPATQLTTSTHDTKRSEDVRARLSLLSEMPAAWREAVSHWSSINERYRRGGGPEREAEYLYYQTLVGAWPLPEDRAIAYMEKAAHEAKENIGGITWREFVANTLADPKFRADLESFVAPLLKPGHVNSLALILLKLTAPGVPDIYQGTELWDLSLVDPDNRRPVDFALRQQLIAKAATLSAEEAWQERASGLPKLWLIRRMLRLRERRPALFSVNAGYEPLVPRGHAGGHVVAFQRGDSLITVVPRLVIGLKDDWRDTTIAMPAGNWHNELTGETLPPGTALLRDLLRKFPVALLRREESP
jgi:(1->4)-alpha-D-glucan 1-alpha-D-glucosylmutase